MNELKEVVVNTFQRASKWCKVSQKLGITIIMAVVIGTFGMTPIDVMANVDYTPQIGDIFTTEDGVTYEVETVNGSSKTVIVTGIQGYASGDEEVEVIIASSVTLGVEMEVTRTGMDNSINYSQDQTFTIVEIDTGNGANESTNISGVTSIRIEENTITTIGDYAFSSWDSLNSITIPSGVTSIGTGTFNDCTNLQSVTINATAVVTIGDTIFSNCNNLQTITVYSESVYDSLMDAKKAAVDNLVDDKVSSGYFQGMSSSTINDLQIVYHSSVSAPDILMYKGAISTEEVWKPWEPTDPDDVYRHSLFGPEKPSYTVLSSTDNVTMVNEIQGPLFFDAVELIQGEYILGSTYNFLVNNETCYEASNTTMVLAIPEALQGENRTYSMFSVTEDGTPISLFDLDQDPSTITFKTDQGYALALGYLDNSKSSGTKLFID